MSCMGYPRKSYGLWKEGKHNMEACPICETNAITESGHPFYFNCPKCGEYKIDRITKGYLNSLLDTEEKKILLISSIRKMQDKNTEPLLISIELVRKLTEIPFPSPQIQMKNLILWLGDKTQTFGKTICENISTIQLELVSLNIDAAKLIITHLEKEGLIIVSPIAGAWSEESYILSLNINGWSLYKYLKFISDTSDTGKLIKHIIDSKAAPYGDPEEIMETFSWDNEQFDKTFRLLKEAGLIGAQYASNKPDTIYLTEKGIETVKIGNTLPSSLFVGGNINGSNIILGNNNTINNFPKSPDKDNRQ